MSFFEDLEALICAQDPSCANAGEVLARMGVPSTSIAILDHGEIFARCISTVGNGVESVFQACSIPKPIAALAVMKLVQKGTLNLEAPITDYLSPSKIEAIATPPTRKLLPFINLKKLMSHTSGLSQGGFPGYEENPPDLETLIAGRPPSNTPQVRLNGLPGDRHSYSGGGISVIQLIVETVTGRKLAELMQELVFEPLEMKRSFYRSPGPNDDYAVQYWTGYTPCHVPYCVLPEHAAAGLWTTPTDLLKAVRAVQHSLTASDDSGFLPQKLAKVMLTEVDSEMGLSWLAGKDPGTVFCHGGSNRDGYRTTVYGYADLNENGSLQPKSQDCGISIMTNSMLGERMYHRLILAIAYLKGWMEPPKGSYQPKVVIPFTTIDPDLGSDDRWKDWQGTWEDRDKKDGKNSQQLTPTWQILSHDGFPFLKYNDLPPVRLLPAAQQHKDLHLVLEGLGMMIGFGTKTSADDKGKEKEVEKDSGAGEKVLEVHHSATEQITTLHRVLEKEK